MQTQTQSQVTDPTMAGRQPILMGRGLTKRYGKVVALTANPDTAIEWGVDETRILPFAESVGGRYSLWSSIGFPAALALGWETFETMLEGRSPSARFRDD